VLAFVVGVTTPWWWSELFPGRETEHVADSENSVVNGEVRNEDAVVDPEQMSKTTYSLPGDAILHFRIASIDESSLQIEVDYTYNEAHGSSVIAGVALQDGPTNAYIPRGVPQAEQGTATVDMTIYDPGTCSEIRIFLYEYGHPSEVFAERVFPWTMCFGSE
jgi:hypothetical protein